MQQSAAAADSRPSASSGAPTTGFGFVGAGELTAAIVEGLAADVADPPLIYLSPRGREVGRALADRFPTVQVCGSNQEVLDNATAIVLAVRPSIVDQVLAELSFRPQHVVISAAAGVGLDRLRTAIAPAGQVTRVIPLPQAARRRSLTAMYPDQAVARELFERVGSVLVPDDERLLEAFSAATATFAAHLDYLSSIVTWMTDQGVDRADASRYVTHIFGELGRSLAQSDGSLAELIERHMTPGGINEQFLTALRHGGMPDLVRGGLDAVLDRLRG